MQITFGDLRSLLQKEPSLSIWESLLSLLRQRQGKYDYGHWCHYTQETLNIWPKELRRTGPPDINLLPFYNYIPLEAKDGTQSLWIETLKQAARREIFPLSPFCIDLRGQIALSGYVYFWESVYAIPLSFVERCSSVKVYTNAHGLKIMCQTEEWANKLSDITCLSYRDRILQLSCDPLPQLKKLTLQNSFFVCPQGFPQAFSNIENLRFLDCHLSSNDCDSAHLPQLKHLFMDNALAHFAGSPHLSQLETLRLRERRCSQTLLPAYLYSAQGFPVENLKKLSLVSPHDLTHLVEPLSNMPFRQLDALEVKGGSSSALRFDPKRVRWSPEVIANIFP